MQVQGVSYQAVFWASDQQKRVVWIDQTQLPFHFKLKESSKPEAVALAIETMEVRGAPTIGATAAYGLALAYMVDKARFVSHWLPRFRKTRPTAVNLFHACSLMEKLLAGTDVADSEAMAAAEDYATKEVTRNKKIGVHLAAVLAVGERRIQTHCNAGWLAAVDWGTALSGVYALAQQGEKPSVLVDETRPRLQGGRLTAWELQQEGIKCQIQVDSAAAWMMAQGMTDIVVVGADRVTANGDVVNKIGTYMLALAAKAHGIPFYVAAPMSTWDRKCASGSRVTIENRGEDELLCATGINDTGKEQQITMMTTGVNVANPAFDITPFELITGIVTEHGIYTGEQSWAL